MRLSVSYRAPKCSINYRPQKASVSVRGSIVKEYIPVEPYDGEYEVTPSPQTVVLATEGKKMEHDVIVNPIPSDWGHIVWNGSVLTVS